MKELKFLHAEDHFHFLVLVPIGRKREASGPSTGVRPKLNRKKAQERLSAGLLMIPIPYERASD
jgi:hypothetical protein